MTGHWTMCSNCQNVLHSETWFTGPGHFMLIMTNFYFCLSFLFFVFTPVFSSLFMRVSSDDTGDDDDDTDDEDDVIIFDTGVSLISSSISSRISSSTTSSTTSCMLSDHLGSILSLFISLSVFTSLWSTSPATLNPSLSSISPLGPDLLFPGLLLRPYQLK